MTADETRCEWTEVSPVWGQQPSVCALPKGHDGHHAVLIPAGTSIAAHFYNRPERAPTPPDAGGTAMEETPDIIERVSEAVHDAWMEQQRRDGNSSRISKGGEEMMVPYAQLSQSCKEYDRVTVRAVLSALPSLGYAVRSEATRPTGEEDTDLARIAEVGVRRIDATNGRLEMDLTVSQEVMCILAEGAMKILDSSGAENYVEMQMRVPSRPEMVTLTIQRWEGRTPHQMRQQAEAEVAALRARLDRAEGIEAAAREYFAAVDSPVASLWLQSKARAALRAAVGEEVRHG